MEAEKSTHGNSWEPKIIAFICNWCSYVGADLAGTSRTTYPENIRIIRVPCTGRIDPVFLVKSFEHGADGVLISGCHPGDCHYNKGNFYARRRMLMLRDLLQFIGLEPERIQMSWVSASEGSKWAKVTTETTETIRKLGPALPTARARVPRPAPDAADGGNGRHGNGSEGRPNAIETVEIPRMAFDTPCDHEPAEKPAARVRK